MIRRSATGEAAALLPVVVGQSAGRVTTAIWEAAKQSGILKTAAALGEVVGNAAEAVTAMVAEGAQTVTTTVAQTSETVITTVKGAPRTVGHQVSEVTDTLTTNATMLTQGLATTMMGLTEKVTASHLAGAVAGKVTAVGSAATDAARKLLARTPWGTGAADPTDVHGEELDRPMHAETRDLLLDRGQEETLPVREQRVARQPTD